MLQGVFELCILSELSKKRLENTQKGIL